MILIGLDEAGLGPTLGPLCHGYSAFRVPDGLGAGEVPCLWELLAPVVHKCSNRNRGGVMVDDSKKMYSSADHELTELERTFCAFRKTGNADGLAALLTEDDLRALEADPWGAAIAYDGETGIGGRFEGDARLVQAKMAEVGVEVIALGACAMTAADFNAALDAGGVNKSDVSWSQIAALMGKLFNLAFAGERVVCHVDRQGGRKFYAGALQNLFAEGFVSTLCEKPEQSSYAVEGLPYVLSVHFETKAESRHFEVALASICAKLTRELCMDRFNAYFSGLQPGLKPTAGYPQDARRFLDETKQMRMNERILNHKLVRSR